MPVIAINYLGRSRVRKPKALLDRELYELTWFARLRDARMFKKRNAQFGHRIAIAKFIEDFK